MLQESGFTLETMPSLQTCKDEAILVQSKGVKTIYFTLSPRATAWDLVEENQVEEVEERSFINEAEQKRLEESYRHCLRLREGFYQISSYRHCCSCLGLFMSNMCGLNMGCKHYLCDSCVCRYRGDADIGYGQFDFPCPERLDDGSICGEIADLSFMDESTNCFRWRSEDFPARQADYCPPSFEDREIIPFNELPENQVLTNSLPAPTPENPSLDEQPACTNS
jgi:hypothetical protein